MSIAGELGPLEQLRDGLDDGPVLRAVVEQVADAHAELLLQTGRQATGGDGRLSNLSGPAMTTELRPAGSTVLIQLRPAGTWALTFGGARPHLIRGRYLVMDAPARSRTSRRATRVRSGYVRHPGTRGSRALDGAVQRLDPIAQRVADDVVEQAVP